MNQIDNENDKLKKKMKEKVGGKKGRKKEKKSSKNGDDNENEDEEEGSKSIIIRGYEMPEGARDSDEEKKKTKQNKDVNDPHRALDINLDE